jgi:hypothetical protein
MRVAICFYGFLRNWDVHRPAWDHIIQKYNADVFVQSWSTDGYRDPADYIEYGASGVRTNEPIDADRFISEYKPTRIKLEDYADKHDRFVKETEDTYIKLDEFINENPDGLDEQGSPMQRLRVNRPVANRSMWYTWHGVSLLKQQHESELGFKYDAVLLARTDYRMDNTFTFGGPLDSVVTPYWGDYTAAINDHWAFGTSADMDLYCNLYTRLEYLKTYTIEEHNFEHYINPHKLPVHNMNTQFVKHRSLDTTYGDLPRY